MLQSWSACYQCAAAGTTCKSDLMQHSKHGTGIIAGSNDMTEDATYWLRTSSMSTSNAYDMVGSIVGDGNETCQLNPAFILGLHASCIV